MYYNHHFFLGNIRWLFVYLLLISAFIVLVLILFFKISWHFLFNDIILFDSYVFGVSTFPNWSNVLFTLSVPSSNISSSVRANASPILNPELNRKSINHGKIDYFLLHLIFF